MRVTTASQDWQQRGPPRVSEGHSPGRLEGRLDKIKAVKVI